MNSFSMLALIFLGGGLGSVTRYGVGKAALLFFEGNKFPLGTLLANTLACIILGFTLYFFKDKLLANEWIKPLVIIGFCGGFSTFSTFSLDTLKLFQDGLFFFGIANILVSLVLGIGILWILVR